MPEVPAKGSGPRLIEAMPRPLLIVFVLACVMAIGVTGFLVLSPGEREDIALFDRRPPNVAEARHSHDVGEIAQIVPPKVQVPTDPPCPAVEGVTVLGGPAGVARIRGMLVYACQLVKGVSEEVTDAVYGLSAITIRFAAFERTGVESTFDDAERTLYLNSRFASTKIEITQVVPILLHEAAHRAPRQAADAVSGPLLTDAEAELRARSVEVQVCQKLIPAPQWPRWCEDAREITDLPPDEALRGLRAAGFR